MKKDHKLKKMLQLFFSFFWNNAQPLFIFIFKFVPFAVDHIKGTHITHNQYK